MERKVACAACGGVLDDDDPGAFNDDDELVHGGWCPLPPGAPAKDSAILIGLGATPAERGWNSKPRARIDPGCAICGTSLAGATSSGSIVVDDEGGGTRFTVCTPCYDEDEPIGVF